MRPQSESSVDAILASLAARNIKMDRMRRRIAAAVASEHTARDPGRHVGPYLAVSRQHGAGGAELAQRAGAALGWPGLDHELVDLVASHLHVNPEMVQLLDEDAASWVSDVLTELMPVEVITRDTYTHHLRRVIQLLAVHGEVILLGHGAQLFLPRSRGISVQVFASLEDRVARVRARTGKDEKGARAEIQEADRARAHFISRTFDRDVADPQLYDLSLNSSSLPIDALTDAVIAACRRRFPLREDFAGDGPNPSPLER
jgi:Cytidylate kinase-like family